jgi:hypothetical protein
MPEDDERHREWSLWAAINIVQALKNAELVASSDGDEAIAIAKEQLYDLLAEPERWAKAFPGASPG